MQLLEGRRRPFWLQRLAIRARASFWLLAAIIIAGMGALATVMIAVDRLLQLRLGEASRFFASDPDGARTMMSTIATSMATIAGVVFSITIVALALAASQYTSRVLRTFVRDRANQAVLGVFVGVYLYCLVVLKSIGPDGPSPFVPSASLLVGVALALVAIAFFIFFIHHISASIQVANICQVVASETLQVVEQLCGANAGPAWPDPGPPQASRTWQPVVADEFGYLQTIDADGLCRLAVEVDTRIRLEATVGDFVTEGQRLVSIDVSVPPARQTVERIRKLFVVAPARTIEQDIGFGMRQLVDIALKALSPSSNDTTTAVICVDHLSAILCRLAVSPLPTVIRYHDGVLRLYGVTADFSDYLDRAFGEVLEAAPDNSSVLLRVLDGLGMIADRELPAERRKLVAGWVARVEASAARVARPDWFRERIDARARLVLGRLSVTPPGESGPQGPTSRCRTG